MGSISGGWRGPGIVGDGLVLYLDAGSPSSYLTEFGTAWKDVSGNGNTGTLTNGPTFSTGSGGSFIFNGVNTYVDCGNRASLAPGTGDFTIEFWINPTNWTNTYAPLLSTTITNGLWIGKNASNFVLRAYNVADDLQYATFPTSNMWTYIIITRNSSIASVYYNTSVVVSGTVTRNFVQGTTEIARDGTTNVFNGKISTVKYYNRALSSTEVLQNYNAQCARFGLPVITDTDVQAFISRVAIAGGMLSATEQTAVNNLVISLKANNLWDSMLAIYPMVGASAAACAQNLKSNSFIGTFTSGWVFSSTGVTPNGTSSCFFDTNFATTTFSTTNNSFGFYTRTNLISTQGDMGALDDLTTYQINMGANYSGAGAFARNFSSIYGGVTNTNTQGFYTNSRILSTEFKMYKNNTLLQTITSSTGTALSGIRMALGGHMLAGNTSVAVPSSKEYSFAFLSNGLDATQNSNFYTAVQTFQTSLSRQV